MDFLQIANWVRPTATFSGTFPVRMAPKGVAFDGANVWVSNAVSNNLSKL